MKVQEIPLTQRPREKAIKLGVDQLHDRELLAIMIRHGYQGCSALQIADQLLMEFGLDRLPSLSLKQITKIKGLKDIKAIELLACFELSKRIMANQVLSTDVVNNPQTLIDWLKRQVGFLQQEHFIVVFLNTKNHIITYKTLLLVVLMLVLLIRARSLKKPLLVVLPRSSLFIIIPVVM